MVKNDVKTSPPLTGVTVLDLTRVLSGPFCTLTLADMGAEIMKVEGPPKGDDTRGFKPPVLNEQATYFLFANRNKKSIAIDLKNPEGRKTLLDLAKLVDVVVENFRPGVADRLGVGFKQLSDVNNELIYCAISGYGPDGPQAGDPGYDPVAQAESGLMALNGDPDRPPLRIGVSLVDMFAGQYAGQAICAALAKRNLHRAENKENCGPQRIDVALHDSALTMLANFGGAYLATGVEPQRTGNLNQVSQPSGVFSSNDGDFMLTTANEGQFERLCRDVLEQPELLDDPDFVDNPARLQHREKLQQVLAAAFATNSRAYWVGKLKQAGVPAGEIRAISEALELERAKPDGRVDTVHHPIAGAHGVVRTPAQFYQSTPVPAVSAPLYGQHSREILTQVAGYDEQRIDQLISDGAIFGS